MNLKYLILAVFLFAVTLSAQYSPPPGAGGTCAALGGDVGGTCAASVVAKVNGIAHSATAAAHSVEVITVANTTATAKVIPDCTDTAGNHINFTQSTDAFSCGTSVPAAQISSFGAGFANAGATITATIGLPVTASRACTIIAWAISIPAADTGTATVKFLKIAAGTASPAIGNSINTSGVALSAGTHVRSTTLGDFTTLAVSVGDVIAADLITVGGTPTGLTATFECQ